MYNTITKARPDDGGYRSDTTNDKDVLLRLLQQVYVDDSLTHAAKKEYEKFVVGFDEDGADLEIPVSDLDVEREKSLQNLVDGGYVAQSLRYHGSNGGHILHVDLRGKRFLELADAQSNLNTAGMQDSGKRQTFSTGAVRDSAEGKPRPDLFSAFAMERIGNWLRLGSLKYAENNWMKGMNYSRVLASLHRHLMKYMQRDGSEDHLAALCVNASFLMHYDAMIERGALPKELNDLPAYDPMPAVHQNGDAILEHEPDEEFCWKTVHGNS